jgi:zinc protease
VTRRFAIALLISASAFAQTKPAASIPSFKDLKYPPLREVKIPEPAQFTLSNGMRLFLLEDHELPLIQGLALIRTGNLFDPPDKRGLSEVMAEVLRQGGTKAKTGDQIDEQLENIAGSVESSMDESSASMSFSALKESSEQVMATFKELMTAPEFRQDKLDLMISQLHSAINRRNDDAQAIPDRELMSILYGRNNSYGWTIEHEHLNHIHRDDLIQFYRRYYFPKNIMLAVYGDFSAPEMKDRLEKLFADWKVEQPAVPPFPAVTATAAPGVYLAEKPDVTQTFFSIGELGGTLRDKDYPALQVAANILGSGFSSRLVSQIRTKLGYAYEVYATWAANYDHPGTFRMGGSTKSGSTTETLQAINVELEKLRTAEVTPVELSEAKESVLNSFVFFFDSPSKTLSRVMRYEYYGYPKDFLFTYQKAIEGVTRADVLRVAKDHFQPDKLTFVAVGNSKAFGKPLTALGKVNSIDLSIPEAKAESSKSDPASVARGHELLKRAQLAIGGAEKLAAVKDSTQQVEMTAPGGMKIKQNNRYLAPAYFRQDQELPFGKIVAYTDGKAGWLLTPQGFQPMPPAVLKQAQGEVFRNLLHVMLADRDASLEITANGENAMEISSKDGQRVKVEIDPATGLPASETFRQEGTAVNIEETFSDWRDVEGLKMPFKMMLQQNGKPAGELDVQAYKLNTGLKADELSQRP